MRSRTGREWQASGDVGRQKVKSLFSSVPKIEKSDRSNISIFFRDTKKNQSKEFQVSASGEGKAWGKRMEDCCFS